MKWVSGTLKLLDTNPLQVEEKQKFCMLKYYIIVNAAVS